MWKERNNIRLCFILKVNKNQDKIRQYLFIVAKRKLSAINSNDDIVFL